MQMIESFLRIVELFEQRRNDQISDGVTIKNTWMRSAISGNARVKHLPESGFCKRSNTHSKAAGPNAGMFTQLTRLTPTVEGRHDARKMNLFLWSLLPEQHDGINDRLVPATAADGYDFHEVTSSVV